MQSLQTLATNDDNDDPAPPIQANIAISQDAPLKMALATIFDFQNMWWQDCEARLGFERSLDDELEFYELLDLDAAGEDDLEETMDALEESAQIVLST